MVSKSVGVVPGPRTSFLDHLIPICHLMDIPIHCSDSWVETCAHNFYPKTNVISGHLSPFDTYYVVEPCRLHEKSIQFDHFFKKGKATTVAGFHGNPDKFRKDFWIERYVNEDFILIYGDQLVDYFKEKGVWNRLKNVVRIGNLRYAFYTQHKTFFDKVCRPYLFPDRKKQTIFWAPTWSFGHTCDDSPFFDICKEVFNTIPSDYQMLVKLHPYTFRLFPEKVAQLKQTYEQVCFIDEIPLVYPFLNQADIFLGDYSSVAYDFLAFNRPLFFLSKKKAKWGHYN